MNNTIRLTAKTKTEEFSVDVYMPAGDMFIIAIVPTSKEAETSGKKYISWAVCEHHKEENAVMIWHIQTLKEYRRKGFAKKLLTVLKSNHDLLETNFETTGDDGYLCLIKEDFKEIKNILDKEKKVLQWKKPK